METVWNVLAFGAGVLGVLVLGAALYLAYAYWSIHQAGKGGGHDPYLP